LANFLDCVRTRKRPNSDIETCVRSSITSILGNLSLRTKMRLDWDDKRQTLEQELCARCSTVNTAALETAGMIGRRAFVAAAVAALPAFAKPAFRAQVGINIYSLRYKAEGSAGTLALIRELGFPEVEAASCMGAAQQISSACSNGRLHATSFEPDTTRWVRISTPWPSSADPGRQHVVCSTIPHSAKHVALKTVSPRRTI